MRDEAHDRVVRVSGGEQSESMRTITLEEHFATPEVLKASAELQSASRNNFVKAVEDKLLDLGKVRIADMDEAGIDLQIISLTNAGLDKLDGPRATALARDSNDKLAAAVKAYPQRFAGFAALALQEPEKAAAEFERCVRKLGFKGVLIHGTTRGVFLDDPQFTPIFEAAQALDVPIYLHPTLPPKPVEDAYFSGLPGQLGFYLSSAAWGWHVETGLHCLRLIASGLFDRFPKLNIIIGHMGEDLPFSIARAEAVLSRETKHLKRKVGEYFQQNFYITTSGYFTVPPFLCTLQVVGADRILFSVDYPYSPNTVGRNFLNALPVSTDDLGKISHGNAERLLKV
jgi:predicted TIM-barrel fold metal-dependent hydrolase